MKLSDNIKAIRKENNLSQEQFAEQVGVSRQAVSKWESGQSYPEMDKVLLICKLYNYNIDELMNENVKEVKETKESKIKINKYIDDFFEFVTKTIDMFSALKFKQKLKCLIEQVIIAIILFIVVNIIGALGSGILHGLLGALPIKLYYCIRGIFASVYVALAIVFSVVLILHIFKVRYLDYYEVVKLEDNKNDSNEVKDNNENKDNKENNKILLSKEKEKIIIRDPEHSQSGFITGIVKFIILCLKGIAIFTELCLSFSFVFFVVLLTLSLLFIKTGLLFIGGFIGTVACIVINYVLLEILFNFVMDKKNHKNRIGIMLLSSLVAGGISIGLILIGVTQFKVNQEIIDEVEDTYNFNMNENIMVLGYNCDIKFVEEEREDVKVCVKYSLYSDVDVEKEEDTIVIRDRGTGDNSFEIIKAIIKDINNKQINNYYEIAKVQIYASKDNIEKIKQNRIDEREKVNTLNQLNEENRKLKNQVEELQNKLDLIEETED